MNRKDHVLAFDIGGSKLLAGIVDSQGSIVRDTALAIPPPAKSIRNVMETVEQANGIKAAQILKSLLSEAYNVLKPDITAVGPAAVGASLPGLTDPARGLLVYAPFSGIRDFAVAAFLEELTGLRSRVENDVNACALAERRFGVCTDCDDFLWITVSNGIGGAIYSGGRLLSGSQNSAGEIGHICVEEQDGRLCGCGRCGCLEAQAAGPAIAAAYHDKTGCDKSAKEIAAAAVGGDATAQAVYEQAGFYIGKACAAAANLVNPKKIVLGGGVSLSIALLKPGIDRALSRFCFKEANQGLTVCQTGLGWEAGLLGAAAVALA